MTVRELLNDVIEGLTIALSTLLDHTIGSLSVAFWPLGILDVELAHALGAISIYAFAYLMYRTARKVHSDKPMSLEDSRDEIVARVIFAVSFAVGLGLAFYESIAQSLSN